MKERTVMRWIHLVSSVAIGTFVGNVLHILMRQLHWETKLVAIDVQSNDDIMHHFRRARSRSFYALIA